MAGFPILDVGEWDIARPEPEGRSGKIWLTEPGAAVGSRERDWLFKREESGIVSRNVAPDRWNLLPGYVLLTALIPGYVGGARLPGRPGHSLANICEVLANCGPPPGHDELSAIGAFAGYLVMDAWVANQDHSARLRLLGTPQGVRLWSERGRALQFEHDPAAKSRTSTLSDVAHRALRLAGGDVERLWLDRLSSLSTGDITDVVSRVAGLSDVAATFILMLLETNRRRLLDDR